MSSSQTLGGPSRCGRIIGPSLDKILKNASSRQHSHLIAASKSALNKLQTLTESQTPLADPANAALLLAPLLLALQSNHPTIITPALDCLANLFTLSQLGPNVDNNALAPLIECVCKCGGNEEVELGVLRVLLAAVGILRGECLLNVVRSCYNVYFGGVSGTVRICAKAVLAQIVAFVFARAEGVRRIGRVNVGELLEFTDKGLNEGSSIHFCQGFVNDVMDAMVVEGEEEEGSEGREDAFLLFRNLCKFSMKFSGDDEVVVRGKTLSLELLKVVMKNAGPVWRTDDRFINAMKQYLCLSLLKNSALSVMAIFQLQCSIFMVLLTKFRSVLKAEIGIFFPMFVLRVVENVLQPSFVQKMTVLNLLEKIAQDPQIMVDIYVNYDCDVDSPNIFERTINGLLKTAQGPPPGSTSTLSPAQDMTFRYESVKCLVSIIKSMGTWMDQHLRVGDSYHRKRTENDVSIDNGMLAIGEEGTVLDAEMHADVNSEISDAATLEQHHAYKLELQKCINLFNRKPSKGIDFLVSTKKLGESPEAVASFLKNTTGLNATMIGDYLGEREDFSSKVLHAYVDSFNFKGIDFSEAIKFFLQGFKLPGEAQKIDRIMEKFAERYCKCNPNSFSSADTAYVLAYSVIMLNIDAHNSMVKDKMTKDDFIKNNRGIDNVKDLSEEYLGAIYDQIVKNEIKIYAESSAPQSKQASGLNRLLGVDGLLNLVTGKKSEEKSVGANGHLITHIQEQFKANSGNSKSVYHAITDVAVLRFMMEVCWGPMLAAFSVTLDQSDDRFATSHCLQGFRYAVHVAAVLGMHTQRDAFVTSIAKFTYLHHAADMKQKNVDAVKAIISIAIEDGDYLQEAWEHILTCLSRIEHLQLLGEGAPTEASFLASSSGISTLKRRATLQNPAVMAVVRGGSYDSATPGSNTLGLVTQEQISSFISNLNLLDQIGTFELNHVFAHSQQLNSEAIVAFVESLCKVAMSELQSLTDPRVFSLTKLVEIAHYNMNRIRLVWSRIWTVLSDFFVSVGLSENLSVSIFVMDSLRQLAVKFLEREELENYNFQNEFLRPFVIVMQRSSCAEIRELIVRCISQMVLGRVTNVMSGWKSVFMIFTAAATDELKSIVILAFETLEKIVREYFLYIIETETVTFTYCVQCLSAFTNSKFSDDVSLNVIANLRSCAVKLADGGTVCKRKSYVNDNLSVSVLNENALNVELVADKDDNALYWLPLLKELSKLSSDSRLAIRKSALEVLFDILKDHGHLFSSSFWLTVFSSVILPPFNCLCYDGEMHKNADEILPSGKFSHPEGNAWDSETSTLAAQYLVELFVSRYNVLRSQLPSLVSVLMVLIRNPVQVFANTGLNALLRVTSELGNRLSEDEWKAIFFALKEAILSTIPGFMRVLRTMDDVEVPEYTQTYNDMENASEIGLLIGDIEEDNLQTAAYVVSRIRSHISVQLLIMQVVADLYKIHQESLSATNVEILLEIVSSTAVHANQLNSETILKKKLQSVCSVLEIAGPPIVSFENDSYRLYLGFIHEILETNPSTSEELNIEPKLVALCQKILEMYLNCAGSQLSQHKTNSQVVNYRLPLSLARKEELATRSKLVMSALHALSGLRKDSFKKYLLNIFPFLVDLVRVEHSSRDIQHTLSEVFQSCIGPTINV